MTTASALVSARENRLGFLEARARLGSGRRGAVLADFLQGDVQGDADTARGLLAQVEAARRGQPPRPEAVGNAFAISITPKGATLRNIILVDRPPERYSLDELAAALAAWLAAIERGQGATG